jgi:hypothetical protein
MGQNDLFKRKWEVDRSIWSGMINLEGRGSTKGHGIEELTCRTWEEAQKRVGMQT